MNKLKSWYYNIKYFILNIYHHRSSLWYSRPWDYVGVYLVLRDNLKYLSDSIEEHGCSLNKDRQVKKMRVCINLLDRLIEDNYLTEKVEWKPSTGNGPLWGKLTPKYFLPRGDLFKRGKSLQKEHREILFILLNKNLHNWWD